MGFAIIVAASVIVPGHPACRAGKRADVYDPPAAPRFALIYLHGIGQETLADKQTYTDLFAALNLGCVVPGGG